ncbi:hypothetical protein [Microlunatus flavus]|uniref:Uncharacterized protein n=1 Tax=Microlunatus flavus TaxID=1036181 RepID=A0A1H9I644_9ACTN|nr:hypothetical protein [Microlunatus flavus]SEQ70049.1 hypothetical protein SAMN05421756_105101 [Microlunatus flavus]
MTPTGAPGAVPATLPAPVAPGRLGEALDPAEALAYLSALGDWLGRRRAELDALDREALASAEPARFTGDVTLAMTLWQAVADREAQLRALWDSGRTSRDDRERMAALVWGRRSTAAAGATSSALELSVPEAGRLLDAVVGELRERLGLEESGAQTTARVAALRAQLERLRDQTALEPAGAGRQRAGEHVAGLASRLAAAVAKAERGGDVGGVLGPIEVEAATLERDLIVGGARRREAGALVARVRQERAELARRTATLGALAERCVSTVAEAPRYAVPDVDGLGPLPNTAPALVAYENRLALVGRAVTFAEEAYGRALRGHDDRLARLEGLRVKAEALGRATEPDLARAYAMAREALDARPSHAALAEQLVTLYATYLQASARTTTEVR